MPETTTAAAPLLIRVEDAATMLAVSPAHIYKLAKRGALPSVRVGTALRFKPQDIHDYIDAQSSDR